MNLIGVADEAISQFKTAQLRNLYRRDYTAWKADVLGYRTYEKMQHITEVALFGDINRTAIKSSNGVSKSFEIAAMIGWVGSVHEPGEAVAILTAPSIPQMEKVTWAYLKANKTRAELRGNPMPGFINESLEWKIAGPSGNIDIAYGRKPAPGKEVSVFQGTRSMFGKTYVFIEEAGGVSKNLFTAAEAVLTGADARGIYIGNPDDAGTEWQQVFEAKKYDDEFNRFTISSFDLPTFTGEIVYPDDPEMQERMLKSLTQKSWVEHKQRIWGEHDARYQSKVLGEFPKDGGKGFFGTGVINAAINTEIEDDLSVPVVLGVDVARMGKDESVIYSNRGGRVRLEDSWGKIDTYETSKRVFDIARRLQPLEIRIDGTGVGAGVWDNLAQNPEFQGSWTVIGIEGASASPDLTKWANKRAYMHDSTREQMALGEIDIDFEDEELREQLGLITYKFHTRGGVQISKKEEMETEMGGSPDRADAFIYATADLSPWTGNPLNELLPGDRVILEPEIPWDENPYYGHPGQAF